MQESKKWWGLAIAIAVWIMMAACSGYAILDPKREFEPVVRQVLDDTTNLVTYERIFCNGDRKYWQSHFNLYRSDRSGQTSVYILDLGGERMAEIPDFDLRGTVTVRKIRLNTGSRGAMEKYILYEHRNEEIRRLDLPGRFKVQRIEGADIEVDRIMEVVAGGQRLPIYVFTEITYDYETKDKQALLRFWSPLFGLVLRQDSVLGTYSRMRRFSLPQYDQMVDELSAALLTELPPCP